MHAATPYTNNQSDYRYDTHVITSLVVCAGDFPGAELVEWYILHCFSFDVVNGVYIEAMIKPLIFDQNYNTALL